ncbi:MAG: hypothetical protein ACXITV_03505 [Luteibaculaceae bacterium]
MKSHCSKSTLYNIVFTIVLSLSLQSVIAQSTNISPYSRYGLGTLNNGGLATQQSMGGIGVAMRDPVRLNPLNPASFTSFGNTTLELGLKTQFLNLNTETESQNLTTTNFNYFAIGLPVAKTWALAFGLRPYSSMGYNITVVNPLPEGLGNVTENYLGDGGINTIFIGGGVDLINKADSTVFSVGVNALYHFGNILRVRKSFFPANSGFLNPQIRNEAFISDFGFEGGAQFSFYPNKKKGTQIILGATYGLESALNAQQEQFIFSFTRNAAGIEQVRDTISVLTDENGSFVIPARLSVGATLVFDKKIWLTAEAGFQDWETFRIRFGGEEQNLGLRGSRFVAFGGMISPYADNPFTTKLAKRMDYSFGFRYEETYLTLRNNDINDISASFGLGFPLRRSVSTSRIGLNVVAGSRGSINDNLIRENYVNVFIGFTLTPHRAADRWFMRRKYD